VAANKFYDLLNSGQRPPDGTIGTLYFDNRQDLAVYYDGHFVTYNHKTVSVTGEVNDARQFEEAPFSHPKEVRRLIWPRLFPDD
jgi:hypothetical protein